MKAYEEILNYCRDEQCLEEFIDYPDDISIIRKHVPELDHLTDFDLATLWSEYSTGFYCASWLTIGKKEDFKFFKKEMIEKDHYEPMYYGEDFYKWKEKNDNTKARGV